MTRHARQLAAAQRQYESMSPDDAEEARDEWIAERAAELTAERLTQDAPVEAAITYMQARDEDGWISAALRRFFVAVESTEDNSVIAQAGADLWRDLRPGIAHDIKGDAESDAAHEYDQFASEDGSDSREAA